MRFSATEEAGNLHRTISLYDRESGAYCLILPELGGTVWQLALATVGTGDFWENGTRAPALGPSSTGASRTPGGSDSRPDAVAQILEADPPELLEENPWFRGRLLIPFNDRIPGGRYRFSGRQYQLALNAPEVEGNCGPSEGGAALHGLVYDQPFHREELGSGDEEAAACLSYRIDPDAFQGYPFRLAVVVRYGLTADALELSVTVKNLGPNVAPATLGWHPYVEVPGGVDSARLLCAAGRYVEVDQGLLPTGKLPGVAGGRFDFSSLRRLQGMELDIALERRSPLPVVRTIVDRGFDFVEVEQSVPPFGYTQLFIPPDRSSIAVEPVTGATNAFNRPDLGLTLLPPGRVLSGQVRIRRLARAE